MNTFSCEFFLLVNPIWHCSLVANQSFWRKLAHNISWFTFFGLVIWPQQTFLLSSSLAMLTSFFFFSFFFLNLETLLAHKLNICKKRLSSVFSSYSLVVCVVLLVCLTLAKKKEKQNQNKIRTFLEFFIY